ncbi:hypothetical protein DB35_04045 [Streptomyces abyssalis]|uniref:Uncharacterized protein n=1 Tax=Streptomyces abyssalis TaxID=933944 RepID=A0A1E7JQ73_9ACTN|nr:hypothetical protein [Streptomyces abyssalis]OEU90410.1 hypothetical protein AN215_13155 [Streptomyces abyssalis]OEU95146.1 hypothetical protein DB35_04045 [Streptomyces abyssalis]OEV30980.1 hypothetical protein AN219_07730 [Streptomyces nanshensis]
MEQQKQLMPARLCVVDPDFDAQCDRAEKLLLQPLAESTRGMDEQDLLADGLAAFRRNRDSLAEAVARGPRVWTPNGRFEHEGLRIVTLPTARIDLLYAVLRELSRALVAASNPDDGLAAALRSLPSSTEDTAVGLVGGFARVMSLMDLTPDADTATLSAALEAADGEDVRLTYAEEDAWQRLAHRVTMLLTESPPLHRFLY